MMVDSRLGTGDGEAGEAVGEPELGASWFLPESDGAALPEGPERLSRSRSNSVFVLLRILFVTSLRAVGHYKGIPYPLRLHKTFGRCRRNIFVPVDVIAPSLS